VSIKCEIDYVELVNAQGRPVRGILATCTRCGNQEESFGTSEGSVSRCLMLIRESCPGGSRHFYVVDDGEVDARQAMDPRYEGDPTCCFTAAGLREHRLIAAVYRRCCAEKKAAT
jgi:hypothetical protein